MSNEALKDFLHYVVLWIALAASWVLAMSFFTDRAIGSVFFLDSSLVPTSIVSFVVLVAADKILHALLELD